METRDHAGSASRSSFRPPQATLQSLPPKPSSFALIWREPKYTVWRPPVFAGFCHQARQSADRNAYSRTPTQLRKLGKKHAALPLPSRSIILDFCRCSCDKNAQVAIVQEWWLCAAGAHDQADKRRRGSRLTSGCIRTRRGKRGRSPLAGIYERLFMERRGFQLVGWRGFSRRLNETRNGAFYRRPHRFRACRVCARCIRQIHPAMRCRRGVLRPADLELPAMPRDRRCWRRARRKVSRALPVTPSQTSGSNTGGSSGSGSTTTKSK
jgi:hypothetical protein